MRRDWGISYCSRHNTAIACVNALEEIQLLNPVFIDRNTTSGWFGVLGKQTSSSYCIYYFYGNQIWGKLCNVLTSQKRSIELDGTYSPICILGPLF